MSHHHHSIIVSRPKRVQQGYPWVYSNELQLSALDKELPVGSLVTFVTEQGSFLGVGTLNRHALIAGRILSHLHHEHINVSWFYHKFAKAKEARERIYQAPFYRWVHAEADDLPGLVIDRYGPVAVVQVNTAGMDSLEPLWLGALQQLEPKMQAWIIRKDSASRQLEQLSEQEVKVIGTLPDQQVIGQEGSIYFLADVLEGQKTGWFYDQRENRAIIARWIKPGDHVLDLFTHTGSFALYAAQQGAIVDAVDRSALALELASKAALLNQVSDRLTWHQEQVFHYLDQETRFFDLVVVDPPAFVKSKANLAQGIQGYIKLLTQALKVVKPNGILCFTSCSHNITPSDILDICQKAASKVKRRLTLLTTLQAGYDHPVRLDLPELTYLKGVLLLVE